MSPGADRQIIYKSFESGDGYIHARVSGTLSIRPPALVIDARAWALLSAASTATRAGEGGVYISAENGKSNTRGIGRLVEEAVRIPQRLNACSDALLTKRDASATSLRCASAASIQAFHALLSPLLSMRLPNCCIRNRSATTSSQRLNALSIPCEQRAGTAVGG